MLNWKDRNHRHQGSCEAELIMGERWSEFLRALLAEIK